MEYKETMAIRLSAVGAAIDLIKSIPAAIASPNDFNVHSVLSDAEKIEEYILGHETKPALGG